ncbi:MAG TPA: SMC-Scp complex subunit ScpB [Deltaproteobacteria bacterium]|nr:SMC-Scp complex subunit ScpB [Deltaproteobacteria bacterium]
MDNGKAVIEALIFVSGSPLTVKRIAHVLEGMSEREIRETVQLLISEYEERRSGMRIVEVAGGYQLRTHQDVAEWIKKFTGLKPVSLSRAALETLAVVAYRQPIMKSEIEKVRGVNVSGTLKGLLEKNMIRIVGRKDVPGRPIIYGTTKKFLEVFNLKDLSELPTLRELKELGE